MVPDFGNHSLRTAGKTARDEADAMAFLST